MRAAKRRRGHLARAATGGDEAGRGDRGRLDRRKPPGLTGGTQGLVGETRTRFGLLGALALGLDRRSCPLRGPGASAGPDREQHHTEPQESHQRELVVEQVRNHGHAPLHGGVMGALYPVSGTGQLSAANRYTTRCCLRHDSVRSPVVGGVLEGGPSSPPYASDLASVAMRCVLDVMARRAALDSRDPGCSGDVPRSGEMAPVAAPLPNRRLRWTSVRRRASHAASARMRSFPEDGLRITSGSRRVPVRIR
jgi:hypothetical protein